MPVWFGLIVAFVSTVIMNAGLALQKQGASRLPKIGKDKSSEVLRAFFTNWLWLAGLFGLLFGWGLYLYSTKIAPISLVQPTLGLGLAVLALFSVFYLKEKIRPMEWIAIAGMILGMILLGISAVEEHEVAQPRWSPLLIITALILFLAFLAYFLAKKEKLGALRTDSLLGMVSGLFIGMGALYVRAMFVLAEAGENLLAFGVCLPVMVGANVLGLGIMQSGFQHGKALIVVSLEAVLNKIVAIIGGIVALGEKLPEDELLAGMRITAFILILFGTGVLSRFGGEEVAEKLNA